MKVIVDTNILVSAVLKGREPEKVLLFIIAAADIEWIVSPEILNKYKEVLSRKKFGLPKNLLKHWFDILEKSIVIIDVDLKQNFKRDTKDAKFLECALAADADFLITGDNDFSEAKKIINTKIVSLSCFRDLFILEKYW